MDTRFRQWFTMISELHTVQKVISIRFQAFSNLLYTLTPYNCDEKAVWMGSNSSSDKSKLRLLIPYVPKVKPKY